MNFNDSVSYERAHELFEMKGDTLLWKKPSGNRVKKGMRAGHMSTNGYLRVTVDSVDNTVHRIVWLMHYGSYPSNELDHEDGNKVNNHISNLRLSDRDDQLKNMPLQSNNKSGYPGVYLRSDTNKYEVKIMHTSYGCFSKLEDAIVRAKEAHKSLGYHTNHGRKQ